LTALHHAALSGLEDTVEELLYRGADINSESKYGSPLILAAFKGRSNVIHELLRRGASVKPKSGVLGSVLHAACFTNDSDIVLTFLLECKELVNSKCSMASDEITRLGGPALGTAHSHIGEELSPLQLTAIYGLSQSMGPLIDAGANVYVYAAGFSVEMLATSTRHSSFLAGYLRRMSPQYLNHSELFGGSHCGSHSDGRNALMLAAYNDDYYSLYWLLSFKKWIIDAPNRAGWSAVHHACHTGASSCLSLLKRYGALMDYMPDKHGLTAAMLSARAGHDDCIRALVACGVDCRRPKLYGKKEGWTPLHFAAANNHSKVITALREERIGYQDIDQLDADGNTPLMVAAASDAEQAVQKLLEHGASTGLTDLEERSAAKVAREHGHEQTARIIEAHEELSDLSESE
jgi:ankyrin repeat protein